MAQVELVALWIGLIASIVGIVLSIVAIVFSVLVDRRSSKVSDHVIRSLQKIESAVDRSSTDTRELIKAAWDKMLGDVDSAPPAPINDASAKEIAAGIAAELRADLDQLSKTAVSGQASPVDMKKLEEAIQSLQASIASQLNIPSPASRPSETFDRVMKLLGTLSPQAQTLAQAIERHHLSMDEYRKLTRGKIGDAIQELRENALLVPVIHKIGEGKEVPCYYYPSSIAHIVRAALPLLPKAPQDAITSVQEELKAVGYPSDHDGHSHARMRG